MVGDLGVWLTVRRPERVRLRGWERLRRLPDRGVRSLRRAGPELSGDLWPCAFLAGCGTCLRWLGIQVGPRRRRGLEGVQRVKAVVCRRYGPPEVLRVEDVPVPVPRRNQVRIRVAATAVTSTCPVPRSTAAPCWLACWPPLTSPRTGRSRTARTRGSLVNRHVRRYGRSRRRLPRRPEPPTRAGGRSRSIAAASATRSS
jgi:hypothetical protein